VKTLSIYIKKFINGIILIIKATLQTKKYNIGFYILIRFILDIFFIYFLNIIKYKKINKNFFNHYNKKKKITFNWFGNNAQIWFFFFEKFKLFSKKISILEIGCFEGLSIIYYYKFLKNINVTAVDSLDKKTEYFKNFKKNTKNLKNFNFFNINAKKFFKRNKQKKYDLIYIDSSHWYKDVLFEGKKAYKLLNKGGILIFDDLLYTRAVKKKNYEYKNVVGGVILFLDWAKKIKVHYIGHQVIIQKV
jgi:hypothetical protein